VSHHTWTAKDRLLLEAHYGPDAPERLPVRDLARRLGLPAWVVRQAAWRFGLARPSPLRGKESLLRELHARGLSAGAVAREVGCGRESARRALRRLGLPALHGKGGVL
jgi:hypothetical protein